MRIWFITLLVIILTNFSQATEWQENEEISALFNDARIEGTFVLYDATNDQLIGYNHARAATRFIPASTFKIPNSLIGLSLRAVESVDEIFPYDGTPRAIKSWEQPMSLREAIKISNFPLYQELARRIGYDPMKAEVSKLKYGNAKIGSAVDNFWLDGSLKISAIEQTLFLARLAQKTLPYSRAIQEQVGKMIELEQNNNWILYGKTGWTTKEPPGTGWWVGWVQKGMHLYTFAINIDMPMIDDAPKRIELGRASLKVLGVLD